MCDLILIKLKQTIWNYVVSGDWIAGNFGWCSPDVILKLDDESAKNKHISKKQNQKYHLPWQIKLFKKFRQAQFILI